MARGEGVKLILEGVAEGWRIAGEIAAANVPVLVTPIENTPASFEALGATLANARRPADAGVLVAIEGHGNHREREMRYNEGNAVANGLDLRGGGAGMPTHHARVFGLAPRDGLPESVTERTGVGK